VPHGTVQCVRTIQYGTCMYDTAVEEGGVIGHLSYSTLLGSLNVLYFFCLSSVIYFISFSLILRSPPPPLFLQQRGALSIRVLPYMIWYSGLSPCVVQWPTSPDEIPFAFRGVFLLYPALLRLSLSLSHPDYSRLVSLDYEYRAGPRPSAPSAHEYSTCTGPRVDLQ